MTTQYDKIRKALKRAKKTGRTELELIKETGSTCPHKRIEEMRGKGDPIEEFFAKRKGQKRELRAWRMAA